jgi:3',5'-cyclic AMP phosphodiesterase CpdA
MKRIAWTTDIHLNFLTRAEIATFFGAIRAARPDAILVGGDIAEADSIEEYLTVVDELVDVPVYVVLGNHDFYKGSIADVRRRVAARSTRWEHVRWLPTQDVVELSPRAALVGHDGFYDARLGDVWRSFVSLSDFVLIHELMFLGKRERIAKLADLADEAASFVRDALARAFARYEQVVVLTHVPPFRDACWYDGAISGDDWLPYFTSKAMGDALLDAASARPDRKLLVLCGHTHGSGYARVRPNVEAFTGHAEYGAPEIQPLLEVGDDGLVEVVREGWAAPTP